MHAQLPRSQHVVLTPQTTYVTGSPNNSPTHQQQQRRTASPVELAQQFRSTSPLLQRSRAERSHVARRLLVDQHNHGASSMMHTPEQTAFHTPRHQHSSYNNRGNNNTMGYFVSGFNHYPVTTTTTTTTPGHLHRDIQLLSAQETKERMVLEVQQGVIRNGIVEQSRAALKQLAAMTPYQRRVQARRERHGMSPEGSGRSPTPQSGKKTPTMRRRKKGEEERRPPWNNTAVGGGVPKEITIDDTEKRPATATTKRPAAVSNQNTTLKRTQQHQATTTEWLSLHCDLYESQFIGYGQVILQAHNQVLLNASKSIARLAFREVGILSEALVAVGEELHDVKLEKDELMHLGEVVVGTTKAGTQMSAGSGTRKRTVLKRSTSLLDEYAKSALSKNNDEAEDDEGIAMEYVNAAAQREMLAVGGQMQSVIDKHHHHDGDADNNASMLTTTTTSNTAAVADSTAIANADDVIDDVHTSHDEAMCQYHTISQPGAASPAPSLTHTNDNAVGNAVEVVYETTNADDDYLSVGAQTPTPARQHPQPHFNYTSTTATTNGCSRSMVDEDNSPHDVVVVVGGVGVVEEEDEQRDNNVAQNGWGYHHLPHHHVALAYDEGGIATPMRSEHNSYSAAMGSTKRVLFELPPSLASARQNSGEFVPTTAAAGAVIAPTQQPPYNSHEDSNFVRHVVHSSTGITVSTTA